MNVASGQKLRIFPVRNRSVFGRRAVFSGGDYFRLLLYPPLKLGFDCSDHMMSYFHLCDFDSAQPNCRQIRAILVPFCPNRKFL
ncbi:DUF3473 domain-containing protein [Loktanella salsilacus]|uniref:DUF3473 domain-containing protein n=1 Tax=Loktanella salsilacus TaxID=195913 RepID=UPI00345E182C